LRSAGKEIINYIVHAFDYLTSTFLPLKKLKRAKSCVFVALNKTSPENSTARKKQQQKKQRLLQMSICRPFWHLYWKKVAKSIE